MAKPKRDRRSLPRKADGNPRWVHCSTHRWRAFLTRDDVRRYIRRLNTPGLREYPCTAIDGCWHYGPLPDDVRSGERTIDEPAGASHGRA